MVVVLSWLVMFCPELPQNLSHQTFRVVPRPVVLVRDGNGPPLVAIIWVNVTHSVLPWVPWILVWPLQKLVELAFLLLC